ncbi:MAG: hypothetical protein ACLTW9_21265 [Enterocloster sp.]
MRHMEQGISPVIVEMADRILPLQLDAAGRSPSTRNCLKHHGCSFRLAARASGNTSGCRRAMRGALILDDRRRTGM